MNYFLKLAFVLISATFLIGCTSKNLQTYSSNQYSFQYPDSYLIEEPTESLNALIIRGDNGRVEIFKNTDFDGERLHGYSGSGIEEFEAKLVPKEKLKIDDYNVWLFYTENDRQTKEEVHTIFESIKTE